MRFSRTKIVTKLDDFEIKRVLGKGNIGKVLLVQNKHTQQLYAMKVMRKDKILDQNKLESILNERDILY
jgi:serine/threonine protein kinase